MVWNETVYLEKEMFKTYLTILLIFYLYYTGVSLLDFTELESMRVDHCNPMQFMSARDYSGLDI